MVAKFYLQNFDVFEKQKKNYKRFIKFNAFQNWQMFTKLYFLTETIHK